MYSVVIYSDPSISKKNIDFAQESIDKNIPCYVHQRGKPLPNLETNYIIHLQSEDFFYSCAFQFIDKVLQEQDPDVVYIKNIDFIEYDKVFSNDNLRQQTISIKYGYSLYSNNDFENTNNTDYYKLIERTKNVRETDAKKNVCISNTYIMCVLGDSQRKLPLPTETINSCENMKHVNLDIIEIYSLINKVQYILHKYIPLLVTIKVDEGKNLIEDKMYKEALEIYNQLFENGIRNDMVFLRLGGIYFHMSNYQNAISWWLKVESKSFSLKRNLGHAYESFGQVKEAVKWFIESIREKPNKQLKKHIENIMRKIT